MRVFELLVVGNKCYQFSSYVVVLVLYIAPTALFILKFIYGVTGRFFFKEINCLTSF